LNEGRASFGPVSGDGLVDARRRLGDRYQDLRAVLSAGALDELRALAREPADIAIADAAFLPVIPRPEKIVCIGLNYRSHAAEIGLPIPDYPTVFIRFPDAQAAHGEPIVRPRASVQHDYEGELAVIIGRPARAVSRADALDVVAGYSAFNDGSIRDWQYHTGQFGPGKNFPKSGAFGPWLVTTDEIPDPSLLTLETRLNGAVVQSGALSDLIFDIPTVIEYVSTFTPLAPGDVIITGTPAGVGSGRKPPLWMKAGDVVEIEIPGIGTLRNPVVDEA
jgi:2-keto-4-pentenoate hydratase/2-oxohepta-3-ene-1,7-dioic acid hydratase in catechol pathway